MKEMSCMSTASYDTKLGHEEGRVCLPHAWGHLLTFHTSICFSEKYTTLAPTPHCIHFYQTVFLFTPLFFLKIEPVCFSGDAWRVKVLKSENQKRYYFGGFKHNVAGNACLLKISKGIKGTKTQVTTSGQSLVKRRVFKRVVEPLLAPLPQTLCSPGTCLLTLWIFSLAHFYTVV